MNDATAPDLLACLGDLEGAVANLAQTWRPDDPHYRADVYRQTMTSLSFSYFMYFHADAEHPDWAPLWNPVYTLQPNPDDIYVFSPIRGDLTYRVSGNRGTCKILSFTTQAVMSGTVDEMPANKAHNEYDDADLGLAHGDPRAAEKTFQLLTQVTGRAGRASKAGRAYLQTYHPEHPVIDAMIRGDREAFYAHEMASRRETGMPPFGRLAALIVSANEHDVAMNYAKHLLRVAPQAEGVKLFGPVDAPLAMVRGRHRVRLLAQSEKSFDLSSYVRFWLGHADKIRGNLRVQVDIDPMSFF